MHGGRRGKGRCGLRLGGRRGRGCGLSRMLRLGRGGRVRRGSGRLHLVAANRTEASAVVNLGATTGTEHIGYLLGVKQQVVRTFGARTTIFTAIAQKLLRNFQNVFEVSSPLFGLPSNAGDYASLWPQFMQKAWPA